MQNDLSCKPNPGMILRAKVDLDIDLRRSVLIGNKSSDMLAGNEAGISTKLLHVRVWSADMEGVASEDFSTQRAAVLYFGGGPAPRGAQ